MAMRTGQRLASVGAALAATAAAQDAGIPVVRSVDGLTSVRYERRIDDLNERLLLQSVSGDPFLALNAALAEGATFGAVDTAIESSPVALNFFEVLQRFDWPTRNFSLQVKGSVASGENTSTSIATAQLPGTALNETSVWRQSIDETYDVARIEVVAQRQITRSFDVFVGAQLNRYEYRYDGEGSLLLQSPVDMGPTDTRSVATRTSVSNTVYYQQLRAGIATENAIRFKHVFFLNSSAKVRHYGDDDVRNSIEFGSDVSDVLGFSGGVVENDFEGNTFLGVEAEIGYQYRLNNRISLDVRYVGDVNWPLQSDRETSSWSSNGLSVGIDVVTF